MMHTIQSHMNIENLTRKEQLEILLRDALAPLVISVLAFVLAYVILSGALPAAQFLVWIVCGIGILVMRAALYLAFRTRSEWGSNALYRFTLCYVGLLFLSGALWGALMFFWSTEIAQTTQLQLFLFPIALAAGAVSGYGTVLKAYMAFILPCLLPVIFEFAISEDLTYRMTALPAVLYLLALIALCVKYQARLRDTISLRIKNEKLVEDLSLQNEELVFARDAAEEANRSKSEFLARMSHEIRTPINGVLGMTQVLQGSSLDGPQRNMAQSIYTSGTSLLGLINDLLDVSKIEAGKLELDQIDFDLHDEINQITHMMSQSAKAKSVGLLVNLDEDVPQWVHGDPVRLRQIITNLLANAIKFTPDGQVELAGTLLARGRNDEYVLQIQVTDSGIGISESDVEKIFGAFNQADGSTTRKFGGTGLGLSIVRQLTTLMGGTVTVESEVDRGSVFTLTVGLGIAAQRQFATPVRSQSSVQEAPPKIVVDEQGIQNGNLLLVEDNIINQQVALAMLDAADYQITLAEHGAEAVDAVKSDRFDLILMDCQMPVMDGYEATKKIRALETDTHTPIIAVTANAMDGDRERCLEAGMDDYLSKPFKVDDLEAMINRWVKQA